MISDSKKLIGIWESHANPCGNPHVIKSWLKDKLKRSVTFVANLFERFFDFRALEAVLIDKLHY